MQYRLRRAIGGHARIEAIGKFDKLEQFFGSLALDLLGLFYGK
jgi:hypothetical protein